MTRNQQILSLAGIVDALARRYPGDRDELRQVAWLGAIRAVDTWNQREPLTVHAWINVKWEIGRYLRTLNHTRARPIEFRSLEAMAPTDTVETSLSFSTDDHGIESAPARIDTQRILDRLAPRDRAIVLLLSEYSQHEIARMLGCGQATIGRVVARARAAA